MQPSKKFNDVNFKFVSPFWTSLFGNTPPILNSIQPSVLSYQKVDKNWVAELELAIERFVVEKFESWRKGISTRWNRLASKSLKQLLSNFEQQKVNGETVEHLFTEAVDVLNLKRIYSMTGLPINVCYSDVPACSDAVYHTDIHQNVSTGVEFAFAVHCVGYPNNFTSVWMFIASLCRR